MSRLFYRPLDDDVSLRRLESKVAGSRIRCRRFFRLALALAAFFIFIELVVAGPEEDGPGLIMVLTLAAMTAIYAIRALHTRPRALAAQRLLLRHRGLLFEDGRPAGVLGEETEAVLGRLRARIAALPAPRGDLQAAFARAEDAFRSSLAALEGREVEGRADARQARERLGATLETFRAVIARIEIDALLHEGLEAGATAALESGAEILGAAPRNAPFAPLRRDAPIATPATGPGSSIAVLPFADLSPRQTEEYFCHGLAEELINALTKTLSLRVVARTSAFAFGDTRHDVREIGEALKVETLVEGSVRKAGERLRITVQLVRTADGRHLWSERYDRSAGDVFAVQDEITAAILEHLKLELSRFVPRKRTGDVDAYHLYLKGRHLWNRRTPADLEESVVLFERAIARDPGYALAWAGLADAFDLLGFYSVRAPREVFPRAKEAAAKALAIDDGLAEAHSSLAFAKLLFDWDWPGAERSFERTFELNPGYATAHHWYAESLAFRGRHDQAVKRSRIALDLDPLSPIINTLLGWACYYARRHREAIEQLKATLRLDPGFAPAEFWLGLAYEQDAQPEAAAATLASAVDHSRRSPMMLAALGRVRAIQGAARQAGEILEELRETARERYVPAYYMAAFHAGGGDHEATLEWLEKALEARDNWLVFLRVDPIWDRLRDDPRFNGLLAEVGFEAESS